MFDKPKLLKEHWDGVKKNGVVVKEGHAKDFPKLKNSKEYEVSSQKFLNNPPKDTLTGIRKGKGWNKQENDTVRYHEKSNKFAIMSKDGTIRTMYKPDPKVHGFKTNKEYFHHETRTIIE